MIRDIKRRSVYTLIKMGSVVGLGCWALVATAAVLRIKPQVLLVGIDSYGTRLITSDDDRLLKLERVNFVKRYLSYAYNYTFHDYDEKISTAGDMMSQKLWKEKGAEFSKISSGLKSEELTQKTTVLEIREIDPQNFEADLDISVQTKLKSVATKLRIQLKVKKTNRNHDNPYPYEVDSYAEHVIS